MQGMTYEDIERQRELLNLARRRLDEEQGREFRRLRQEARLSLRALAARVGVSAGFLCDVELGKRGGQSIAEKVRAALGGAD